MTKLTMENSMRAALLAASHSPTENMPLVLGGTTAQSGVRKGVYTLVLNRMVFAHLELHGYLERTSSDGMGQPLTARLTDAGIEFAKDYIYAAKKRPPDRAASKSR